MLPALRIASWVGAARREHAVVISELQPQGGTHDVGGHRGGDGVVLSKDLEVEDWRRESHYEGAICKKWTRSQGTKRPRFVQNALLDCI